MRKMVLICLLWMLGGVCAIAQTSLTTPNYHVPIHGHGRYITTPQGRIYYETEGHGSPIVLVAGGPGGSHAAFHPWFSRLAAHHRVIYFDNLGRGRSDRLRDPKKYTIERDIEDIEALRVALKLKTITLLGQSYGGMPALAYALKYPELTDHLILSDTILGAKGFQQNIDSCNHEASTRFPETWKKLTAMRAKSIKTGSELYEKLYSKPTDDLYWYHPENDAKIFRSGEKIDDLNNAIYYAMVGDDPEWIVGGTIKGYDPRPEMKNLAIPTLICVGRFDRVALPEIAQEIKDVLPAHTSQLVVFERSGHYPWIEEADRYFKIVSTFLDGSHHAQKL